MIEFKKTEAPEPAKKADEDAGKKTKAGLKTPSQISLTLEEKRDLHSVEIVPADK